MFLSSALIKFVGVTGFISCEVTNSICHKIKELAAGQCYDRSLICVYAACVWSAWECRYCLNYLSIYLHPSAPHACSFEVLSWYFPWLESQQFHARWPRLPQLNCWSSFFSSIKFLFQCCHLLRWLFQVWLVDQWGQKLASLGLISMGEH